MKEINVKGITYLEKLQGTEKWYWASDYIHGDLYEAEEMFNNNYKIKSNSILFVSYPEGKVIEPIKAEDGQYFGIPIYHDNSIVILLVDFNKKIIKIEIYNEFASQIINSISIPLNEVKDCYNLRLETEPLMLTRSGKENLFEIIYPNKIRFEIESNESFCFKKDNYLYFSAWFEDKDDGYHEEVIIRDTNTGNIIERKHGSVTVMPDGQKWLLT